MTIHEAILHGERLLRQYGISEPRWHSERLLLLALRQTRAHVYANLSRELTATEASVFERLLEKRATHYPLAYLEGTQEFFGREFFVNEAVLIPRPETEVLISAVLDLHLTNPRILDLGSGSGAIAVTLALEIPGCSSCALDLSADALQVLQRNNSANVLPVRGDFFSLPFLPESFNVITANLPYVELEDFSNLPAETKWEPEIALRVESLEEAYRRVVQQSARVLQPGGHLLMEFGFAQEERLKMVCALEESFELLEIRSDKNNIPRVLMLQRSFL